jgi:hypothetical protein
MRARTVTTIFLLSPSQVAKKEAHPLSQPHKTSSLPSDQKEYCRPTARLLPPLDYSQARTPTGALDVLIPLIAAA